MLQNPRTALRALLAQPGLLLAVGVYDGISARVAEQAGFPIAYLSGAGAAAGYLGEPDIGLTNGSDLADVCRHIALKAHIPVVVDADTGYGPPLNVIRTVQALELSGAAGIQLEDQLSPKRCGHLAGKQCIPTGEFVAKLHAACRERVFPDTVIVARTDARAVYDLDEALRRGEAYLNAGADALFIEAPETLEEVAKIAETFRGVPLFTNQVIGGKTPRLTAAQAEALGYGVILYPDVLPFSASVTFRRICAHILQTGQSWDAIPGATDSRELFTTMGMQQWREKELLYTARQGEDNGPS